MVADGLEPALGDVMLTLTGNALDRYLATILGSHEFSMTVDVLTTEEKLLASLVPQFLDGQVNLQRDATIKRTATFSFFDPDHELGFDNDTPFAGSVFADRMLRATHTVSVPTIGDVSVVAFVGLIVKVSRADDVLAVECQDKTLFAVEGTPHHKTVKKGTNAVDAIEAIMRQCTGERRFRFPKGTKARLPKSYTVGLKPESSPWAVCQKIAKQVGMELFYAADGALVLRRRPQGAVLTLREGESLTSEPTSENDISTVRNFVAVTGERKIKVQTKDGGTKKKAVNFTRSAKASPRLAMSAPKLGRNGVPRWLPLLIDDSSIKKGKVAARRAKDELAASIPVGVAVSASAVPVFHLEYGDPVRLVTKSGALTVPFVEASIPLGDGGDMTIGAQRRVSKPVRR